VTHRTITGIVGDLQSALIIGAWYSQKTFQFEEGGAHYRCLEYSVWFAADGEHYEAKIVQVT